MSAVRPVTTRISTVAAPASRPGRRRTGRSWTPTSCSGIRSGSPTFHAPRTGPSCLWSTPGSACFPSASSTAIPLSTCRRRPTGKATVMAPERGQAPQEFHPPVEEYLETMLALGEEGVPVIQARIAERLRPPPPHGPGGLRNARRPDRGGLRLPARAASGPDREWAHAGREGGAQTPPGRAPAG